MADYKAIQGSLMAIKFTYEELIAEGQKFSRKGEFEKKSPEAYKRAFNKGVLHKITSHMDNPQVTWTNTQIFEEASNYKNLKDFEKSSYNAYKEAVRKNLLKEITSNLNNEKERKQEARYEQMRSNYRSKSQQSLSDDSFNRDIRGRQILTKPYKSFEEVPHWLYAIFTIMGFFGGGIPGVIIVFAWVIHASGIYRNKETYRKDAALWNAMYPDDKVDTHID